MLLSYQGRASSALLMIVAVGLAGAWAHATATIYNLGTVGGTQSQGFGINATGQLAGWSYPSGADVQHAFLYSGAPGSGGSMIDLGTLGGTDSQAFGINSAGQLAGASMTTRDATRRAFLYTGTPGAGGKMVDLGTLGGGTHSLANAINASGQVA